MSEKVQKKLKEKIRMKRVESIRGEKRKMKHTQWKITG